MIETVPFFLASLGAERWVFRKTWGRWKLIFRDPVLDYYRHLFELMN